MTSDETQIEIFANWPMSHAKREKRTIEKSRISCPCRDKETTDRQKLFRSKIMAKIYTWFFCETVFVCPHFSYRGSGDMIFWIFPVNVLCHAFCMWHWSIGKDLDLSFIRGHHHLDLVGMNDQSISWWLHNKLHRANETQQGRNFSLNSIMSLPR